MTSIGPEHLSRDSDMKDVLADQQPAPSEDAGRRLVLRVEDRESMLIQLEEILGRTHRLEEHLEIVAAVAGTTCSDWTERQLGALCDAAKALARAVRSAPLHG